MLAELVATTTAVQSLTDAPRFMIDDFNPMGDIKQLNAGDSAEWAAGVMYAYTGQTVDIRDKLVACSVQNDDLDTKLGKAYKRYGNENYDGGNKAMVNSEQFWRISMAKCDETNDQFDAMFTYAHTFFGADDWEDTVHNNYTTLKADIDEEWA